MINALRVDTRRFLMTKSFVVLAIIAGIVQPLSMSLLMRILSLSMHADYTIEFGEISSYSSMASIYLAVFVTFFLHAEAGEGIIRNKIISGKKRFAILGSYSLVNAFLAAVLQIMSVLIVVLLGKLLGATFLYGTEEIVRFTVISIMAGVAISIFYTMLYMCFCTSKIAIALPVSVAAIMKLALIVIMDALYTESGVPKATGMTLYVFEKIDRYVSFSHLTGALRFDNGSYVIGSLGLVILSIAIGSIIFSKKDLS